MNLGTLVARAAQRHGTAIALEEPGRQLSFVEVADRSRRLGRGLLDLGLTHGDRVLDLQSNGITYVETDFGVSSAGLVRVALNYRLSPNDWCGIARDCDAKALIYRAEFADSIRELRDVVDHTIVIGDGDGIPYDRFLADSEPHLTDDMAPDALISLNYSSGTTGKPKGATRTHQNRIASLYNILTDIMTPTPVDVWCHAGPITHASGLFVLPHFLMGARQFILPTFDPDDLFEAVNHRGVTGTVLVPTMVARLLMHDELNALDTSGLQRLVYAGSPMPSEQIRETFERITSNLIQMYGLVEAIPPVTVLSADDHALGIASQPELLTSAGFPCAGVEVRIVDEHGGTVPPGEVGELITRGDHTMSGYWGTADDSEAKSVVDGWLHTGDLGKLDSAGRVYLVDRKGDMIISGGYNVFPREVEDVIAELPGIAEVAVVGVRDAEWGQRIVALYSVREGEHVASESVLAHCRQRLATYKKPKDIRQVDAFPLQATGKISKKQLRLDLEAEGANR
jgi:acyl-CoA synthetase (AMP-forming)/AMP-acid ligase II